MLVHGKIAEPFWGVGDLSEQWAANCIKYLLRCAVNSETALVVVGEEKNGNIWAIISIAETLRATNVKLITVGFGSLRPVATALFCLGDERILMKDANLLFAESPHNSVYFEKTKISEEEFKERVFDGMTWSMRYEEAKLLVTTCEYADIVDVFLKAYAGKSEEHHEPFFFAGDVDASLTKATLKYLYTCAANGREAFFEIMSPGGSCECMSAITSTLEITGVKLTTIGGGVVASAAADLFLLGDRRALKPRTRFLLHECRQYVKKSESYFEHNARASAESTGRWNDIIREMCTKKTKITREEFDKRTKYGRDWTLSDEEVNKFGITTHSYEEILKEILKL